MQVLTNIKIKKKSRSEFNKKSITLKRIVNSFSILSSFFFQYSNNDLILYVWSSRFVSGTMDLVDFIELNGKEIPFNEFLVFLLNFFFNSCNLPVLQKNTFLKSVNKAIKTT